MKVQGACHCGAITYDAEVDPAGAAICHCTDCQVLTGTGYRATVPAVHDSFALRSGHPTIYVKTAESGTQRAHAFCPSCGSPIYSTSLSGPRTYSLRVGGLRQRAELAPARQVWCRSALPWAMNLTGVPQVARQ